jgi:hypothetical protein
MGLLLRIRFLGNHPMLAKVIYTILLLALSYVFHRAEVKTRGKGTWGPDRWLFGLQCYLQATALFLWLI